MGLGAQLLLRAPQGTIDATPHHEPHSTLHKRSAVQSVCICVVAETEFRTNNGSKLLGGGVYRWLQQAVSKQAVSKKSNFVRLV